MEFSKRMDRFGESIFTVMKNRRTAVEARGQEVIDFSIGAPNIPPAPHITKVLSEEALKPENYLYAIVDLPELLEAVAQWYRRRYGVTLDPKTQITSVLGSQEGLSHIGLSILNEGDVVLLPEPCYPVFADGAALAGAELHYMPLKEENDYLIDLDAIPEELARRAKLMIVSYPNNPTCALAPEWFYDKLIAFAKKYDIIVIHDNAYSELVYDGATCGSFLSHPGAMEVGVEFNSLSKTYGMAGARVGFCVGNPEVVGNLRTLKSNLDFGIFLPIQKAAIAAITGDQRCGALMRPGGITWWTSWESWAGTSKSPQAPCSSGLRFRIPMPPARTSALRCWSVQAYRSHPAVPLVRWARAMYGLHWFVPRRKCPGPLPGSPKAAYWRDNP